MDDTSPPPAADDDVPPPVRVALESRHAIDAAIDALLPVATRSLCVFDAALGPRWNLDARIDALRAFCLAGRRNRLRIVVHDARALVRDCPRLVALTRPFAHVIAIHETHETVKSVADPLVLADDLHYVHRFHVAAARAVH
nr:hypothetical protein [Burkholderiales bacterium]